MICSRHGPIGRALAARPYRLGLGHRRACLHRHGWTEVGAECVGIFQSLLGTCRLQGVDPYTYLVDVLQRVEICPATDVSLLTPRLWKEHLAERPRRSDLDGRGKTAGS